MRFIGHIALIVCCIGFVRASGSFLGAIPWILLGALYARECLRGPELLP